MLVKALQWINDLGSWAAITFIGLYILMTVGFVPGTIPTLAAGALFGVVTGTIYVSIGATIGALLAFLIGRRFARTRVANRMENNPKLKTVDRAIGKQGGKIVFLLRLSPVFPFTLLNYFLGVTKVKASSYTFASWIGMLPGTLMYVYIGSLIGDIASIAAGGRERTNAEWAFYIGGLVVTVIVTLFITKIARKALDKNVDEADLASRPPTPSSE